MSKWKIFLRQLSIYLVLVLGFFIVTTTPAIAFSGSGAGTEEDPYIITSVLELQEVNDDLTAYYILGNDIDASATSAWNNGKGFDPIGHGVIDPSAGQIPGKFTGTFDGKGKKIIDLYINRSDTSYTGLFSWIQGSGVVKNLGLENMYIQGGDDWVGGISAYAKDGATITNCYTTGSVASEFRFGDSVGGIVGFNYFSTVSNSHSSAAISGSGFIGGVVGFNFAGTILNSYATGPIDAVHYAGGLVGYIQFASIRNSYSTGTVIATDPSNAGGFAGYMNQASVLNAFWDTETSGMLTSVVGTGKTTAEMKNIRTFTDPSWSAGLTTAWDFRNNPYEDTEQYSVWDITNSYPFLSPIVTVIGPSIGYAHVESAPFTITPPDDYTGTITVTPSGGGLSTPIVLTFSSDTPQTFTITPSAQGPVALTFSSTFGAITPPSLTYEVLSYTVIGPTHGNLNRETGSFTITPPDDYTGTITVTPSGGGLSTPIVLTFSSDTPQTFTITPTSLGVVTLYFTNSGQLANPIPRTYTVSTSSVYYFYANNSEFPDDPANYFEDEDLEMGVYQVPDFSVDEVTIIDGVTFDNAGFDDYSPAIFNGNASNNGTVTGDAIFMGDSSQNNGTVIGTKTRIYTSNVSTVRDFTDDWIVVADGAVVDVTNTTYDDTTIFVTRNRGSFIYPKKSITSFDIPRANTTINQKNHQITVTVPIGTSVVDLTPTIEFEGDSIVPDSGQSQNFTSPVIYTVTATDGSTQTYTVIVKKIAQSNGGSAPRCRLGDSFNTFTGNPCLTLSQTSQSNSEVPTNIILLLTLTRTLKLGMTGPDVLALQQYLNSKGFTISLAGPGSPGQETTYFGAKTKAAVIKFQLANKLKGDGVVGVMTRAYLK